MILIVITVDTPRYLSQHKKNQTDNGTTILLRTHLGAQSEANSCSWAFLAWVRFPKQFAFGLRTFGLEGTLSIYWSAKIWARGDFISLLLPPLPPPFYGGSSLPGVSLHCLQNPRLAWRAENSGKYREEELTKLWHQLFCGIGDLVALIRHHFVDNWLSLLLRRPSRECNETKLLWKTKEKQIDQTVHDQPMSAIMAKARGLSDRWRNDRLKMLVVKNFLKI